jgi:hypothetical protein
MFSGEDAGASHPAPSIGPLRSIHASIEQKAPCIARGFLLPGNFPAAFD